MAAGSDLAAAVKTMSLTKDAAKALILANLHWIILGIIGLCLILYVVSSIDSCNSKKFEQKTNEQKGQISEGKGEVKQIEEQRTDEKQNINAVDNKAAAANGNFNAVINTDSSTRDKNWSNAKREWCRDHQTDSKCQQ